MDPKGALGICEAALPTTDLEFKDLECRNNRWTQGTHET